jgi:hypothetical protein
VWNFETTIAVTARWYKTYLHDPFAASSLTIEDIRAYTAAAHKAGLPWAQPSPPL